MCAVEDCEPFTVYTSKWPTARKAHRCVECRRSIRRGERYHHFQGLCDGTWSTVRTCLHCEAMTAWMNAICGGWPIGQLLEELEEHFREGYASIRFARLIVGMRRRWHDGADQVPDGVTELATELQAEVTRQAQEYRARFAWLRGGAA